MGTGGVGRPFFQAGEDAVAVAQRIKSSLAADVVAAVVETVPAVLLSGDLISMFF